MLPSFQGKKDSTAYQVFPNGFRVTPSAQTKILSIDKRPGTMISSNTSHHVTTKIPRLLKIVEDKQRSEEQGGLPNQ